MTLSVQEMLRELHNSGIPDSAFAREFNTSTGYICQVRNGHKPGLNLRDEIQVIYQRQKGVIPQPHPRTASKQDQTVAVEDTEDIEDEESFGELLEAWIPSRPSIMIALLVFVLLVSTLVMLRVRKRGASISVPAAPAGIPGI